MSGKPFSKEWLTTHYPEEAKQLWGEKKGDTKFTDEKMIKAGFVLTERGWEKPMAKQNAEVDFDYSEGTQTVKLFIKPLSTNSAWKGQRFRSDAYKAYEQEVLWSLPEIVLPEAPYCVSYEFGFSSSGFDLDNAIKQTTDILSKRYRFNDNQIFEMNIKKVIVPKKQEYIQFKIESR